MSAIGWQVRLNEASTPEFVADVCRDFLSSWPAESLAKLPPTCQPDIDLDAQAISPFALKLIRHLGVGERASAPELHEITTFFTKAALRLAQLSNEAIQPRARFG